SVRIADQRNHGPRRALAPLGVQGAGPLHLVELAADLRHAVADHPAVRLARVFAGPAEKADPAALALEVGPAANQASRLIFEVGKLDLELAFRRRSPLAENFQDQAGTVDDLG